MNSTLQFSDIAKEFHIESIELLEAMENSLVYIRENGMDDEAINAVFRAAHTIKGAAGMYKIDFVVEFTHIAENVLDQVRNGTIAMSDELSELLLECKDHIQHLVEFAVLTCNEEAPTQELCDMTKKLGASLNEIMPISLHHAVDVSTSAPITPLVEKEWTMQLKLGHSIMEQGFEPASFLAYLRKNSATFDAKVHVTSIPVIEALNPTQCYLSFEIEFTTSMSKEEILDVFDFIKDDCEIVLNEQVTAVSTQSVTARQSPKEEVKKTTTQAQPTAYSIRVDAEKIDQLINLIGEMVIANANVVQQSIDMKNSELIESVSIVSRMLEDIREGAMQIRMVQIGETFNKFKRIVMDLSKKLGKEIDLVIKGGETELDKTVVEKITDPLVHIVRNAIDHGIELPSDRGDKSHKGTLTLNAYHDAGTVVIEISDDGKGLDEEMLYKKGVEKGLIEEGVVLSQQEIYKLILAPGFSTAPAVTDLSGRGVGMDVVKRNIEALRGDIEIKSKKGEGTTLIIRLPLTLAIIDGFLVKVGETFYVVPLDMVVECIEINDKEKAEMHGNNYINLRGSILPLLNIGAFFDEQKNEDARANIVVVHYAGRRYGFIVDELFGEFQTVIKPLGKIFHALKGISGATILGSGTVALILDVPMLINFILTLKGGIDESKSA
ncbi:chemotaxis protein CheA [Sulfurospirillum oryzae]|uniref:chemotaxis protein CheA n=1 Tax=Sulfurospirillum oryzae TaxID=2976535 RepID=UPI0021E92B54|nr:chemotaxis protein CheA [Sulfurospirillum oryzae]